MLFTKHPELRFEANTKEHKCSHNLVASVFTVPSPSDAVTEFLSPGKQISLHSGAHPTATAVLGAA